MAKTLSIDLGSNSIGTTIRNLLDNENQFEKTTVITFDTGVGKDDKTGKYTLSHAAERTQKRSIRRLYQSRKYKLWTTLEVLREKGYCPISEEGLKRWKYYDKEEVQKGNGGRAYPVNDIAFTNWIKLDFNGDGKPDYTSPYELRMELISIDNKLDLEKPQDRYKLGRALYHIAQHRGFKSSKKIQNADDEKDDNIGEDYSKDKGAEGKKRNNFWKEIEKLNLGIKQSKTVGEVFGLIEKSNKESGTHIRIRQELHQYVTRKMLMQEVDTIFKHQGISFGSIFHNKKGEALKINQSPMFWQRPLRSQKGTIGKCTLETNKFRCPVSHPDFEEFRAWSFLNNIQYREKNVEGALWKQLSLEYRKEIYDNKFFRISKKDFYFGEIAEWIKTKNQHDNWQLNYEYKTNVSACPVSAKLKDIFGDDWKQYELIIPKIRKVTKKDGSIQEHEVKYKIEDIWHILFESDDEDFIEELASSVLNLDEKKANRFLGLYKSMPVAYSMLSLKAIRNILPFLRAGFIYTDATLLAKVPTILGESMWKEKKDDILKNLQSDVIAKNRDEKKLLNVVNNLIAQYKSLPDEEKFAENKDYQIGERDALIGLNSNERDINQILNATIESFGTKTWNEKTEKEKHIILNSIKAEYQSFFSDQERKFKKLPHLQLSMKRYLADNFEFLKCPNTFKELKEGELPCSCNACKKLNTLYHPSQINIYPPAKEGFYKYGRLQKYMVMLGSPKTGAFKNPMAMRALHELRKYINYLIATEQIDEQTRIVLEIPRDSNLDDNNTRWAWTEYQSRREKENKEFRDAIYELLNDPEVKNQITVNPDNATDIDKFRIWYEMLEGGDTEDCFIEKGKFVNIEKTTSTKKNKRGQEEEFEEFNEDNYLKINKSLYFKLQKAADNIQEKYRLWKQQECRCIYTGKMIKITDLFKEDIIDFEHTIPRSRSLDNSLANLTVCYKNFNRNIKKNRIPSELDNYECSAYGYDGSILKRIEKWEQKVKDLELHVDFWKTKSRRATTKSAKDDAIRQRHLWEFELKYWQDKVSRFKMKEVTSGFRKSQLIDTQIISKYALHYLKTFFNTVDVQKGINTAEFRTIFGIQEIGTLKDRSKHSHHAKDAIILSLIPSPVIREQMLVLWYRIKELKDLLQSETEFDRQGIIEEIKFSENKLSELKLQCNLPKNLKGIVDEVDDQILINNITKDQTLSSAKKRVRSRGKIVPLKDSEGNIIYQTDENGNKIQRTRKTKDGEVILVWKTDHNGNLMLDKNGNKVPVYLTKEKWAKGDSIRGQLHKDSFLGAIKLVKKDESGKWIKDENGKFEFEEVKYVIREELVFKKNAQSPGFTNLDDLEKQIVDKDLFRQIKKQVDEIGDFKQALADGIWMLNKDGEKVNKIRRVRIVVRTKNPIDLKKQTNNSTKPLKILPDRRHKESYWVQNDERPYYGMYKNDDKLSSETFLLKEIAERKNKSLLDLKEIEDIFEKTKGDGRQLNFTLIKGQKVIFLKKSVDTYKDKPEYYLKTLYKVIGLEEDGRVKFQHHLYTNLKDISSKKDIDFSNPHPFLRLTLQKIEKKKPIYNLAVEGKHFEVMPDGEIKWIPNK